MKTAFNLHGVRIMLFHVHRLVPRPRGRETRWIGDVERHQVQRCFLEPGSLWTRWLWFFRITDAVVEKHPFCGGWTIVGFGVVYR